MAEPAAPVAGPASSPAASPSRRTFGPVVLLGLAGGAAAAVGGSRPALRPDVEGETAQVVEVTLQQGDSLSLPLVTSLGLVVLACWGVVLVTRGRVRRAVTVLAALAATGALVAALAAWGDLQDTVDAAVAATGATGGGAPTGWYVLALVGPALALVAALAAVRLVPRWPEMGSRYDAPSTEGQGAAAGARPGAASAHDADADADPAEASNLDLWRAIDEGRDPTERPPH